MQSRQFLEVVPQTKRNKSEEKTKTSPPPPIQALDHQNTRRSRCEEPIGNEKLPGCVCAEINICHNLRLKKLLCLPLFSFLKILAEHKNTELQSTSGDSNEGLEMADHTQEMLPAAVEAATQTRNTGKNVSVQFRSSQTSRGKFS